MSRRHWLWVGQGALVVAVALFVGRALARHWAEFRSLELDLQLRVGWIALAALIILATYGLLIEGWRRVLAGWEQQLAYRAAVRIWCVSNLGRYLPGKIWSVAGLAVLAQRAGVQGWAAVGSALTMQLLAVGTAASVAAAVAPGTVSTGALIAAVLVTGAVVFLLTSERFGEWVARVAKRTLELRALPARTALLAASIALVSWVGYGIAFWCLARGLLPEPQLPLHTAVGVFAVGYVVGLVALFAPGGVGVREVMLIAMLTPAIGSGSAVAVSVASRLLLTLTEVGAAGIGVIINRSPPGEMVDAS